MTDVSDRPEGDDALDSLGTEQTVTQSRGPDGDHVYGVAEFGVQKDYGAAEMDDDRPAPRYE